MKRITHLTGESDFDDVVRKVNELIDNHNENVWKKTEPVDIDKVSEPSKYTQFEQDDVESYLRNLFPPTYSSNIGRLYEGSEMLYAPYQEVVYHVKRLLEESKN